MQRRQPKYCDQKAFDLFCDCLEGEKSDEQLFASAVAISLHFLPHQSLAESMESIHELAATVRGRVRNPTPEALVTQLHEVLFEEIGFGGDESDYYNVDNSLIPRVLETHRGIPITLCLIYKTVGALVDLSIEGVNSPGHFLARVHVGSDTMLVDPFHRGRVLSAVEGVSLIERVVQQPWQRDEDWFPVCDTRAWLHRILNNLRSLLIHAGRYRDVAAMRELQSVLNEAG
jgi:regulator of sirC expression with transglutaminase-like and TPR domain